MVRQEAPGAAFFGRDSGDCSAGLADSGVQCPELGPSPAA